jgi:hypothetical protein
MVPGPMGTKAISLKLIWERNYPFLLGLSTGLLAVSFAADIYRVGSERHWEISEIYTAGFEFGAISATFLFTFYTFVVTAERGFIAQTKHSIYYAALIRYTLWATALSTIFSVASIPMMVVRPTPFAAHDFLSWIVGAWTFLAVWAVGSFIRAARVFIEFARRHG